MKFADVKPPLKNFFMGDLTPTKKSDELGEFGLESKINDKIFLLKLGCRAWRP